MDINSANTNKIIQLFSKKGHRGKEIKQRSHKPEKHKTNPIQTMQIKVKISLTGMLTAQFLLERCDFCHSCV